MLPKCEADVSADVICEIDEQIELGFPGTFPSRNTVLLKYFASLRSPAVPD
jgi:hypothetical protein